MLLSRHCGIIIMVTLTLTLASASMSVAPGVKVVVSERGIQFALMTAIKQFSEQMTSHSLPDQKGTTRVGLADASYSITKLRVKEIRRPSVRVSVSPGSGLVVRVQEAGATVQGVWSYKYLLTKDSGSTVVTLSGVSMTTKWNTGMSEGRLTVQVLDCVADPGSVELKIQGGAAWLYNMFKSKVANTISDKIRNELCRSLRRAVDVDLRMELGRLKVQDLVPNTPIVLDYRLVSPPVLHTAYVQTSHKGEFHHRSGQSQSKFQPAPIAEPSLTKHMATICISDDVGNSLLRAVGRMDLGKLAQLKMLEFAEGILDTSCSDGQCIGTFIKALERQFPNSRVELGVETTSDPTLNTTPKGASGKFEGVVTFNVRGPDGSQHSAFSAYTVVDFFVSFAMEGNNLKAQVDKYSFEMSPRDSHIGAISNTHLNLVFGEALDTVLIPFINDLGRTGLRLPPVAGIHLTHSTVSLYQGSLCVGADLKYGG